MDRYELMDAEELLRMQEEERKRNALLQMMRVDVPGQRIAARKTDYTPLSFMDELRQAWRGLTEEPPRRPRTIGVRG